MEKRRKAEEKKKASQAVSKDSSGKVTSNDAQSASSKIDSEKGERREDLTNYFLLRLKPNLPFLSSR